MEVVYIKIKKLLITLIISDREDKRLKTFLESILDVIVFILIV